MSPALKKLAEYVQECNIDIDVALEDIGMEPGAFTGEDLENAGYHRCTVCSAWYPEKGLVNGRCGECMGLKP